MLVLLVLVACGLYSGLPFATDATEIPRYSPVDPSSDAVDVEDFPTRPPVELSDLRTSKPLVTFMHRGMGGHSTSPVGMRMRQMVFAASGNTLTVANASGAYLYATHGLVFTKHDNSNFYDAQTGERLATLWKWFLSLHATYEIETYEPLACAKWTPTEAINTSDSVAATYPFLRLTKTNLAAQKHWVVQKYTCDADIMEDVFIMQERYRPQLYLRMDILQVGHPTPVATIDQPYFFEMSSHLNIWTGVGSDPSLMALLGTVVHMHSDYVRRNRGSGDSRRRSGR